MQRALDDDELNLVFGGNCIDYYQLSDEEKQHEDRHDICGFSLPPERHFPGHA